MNFKLETRESASVGLLDRTISRFSYTVSPSYLLEAELDREWEKQALKNQECFSGNGVDTLTTEEGRA